MAPQAAPREMGDGKLRIEVFDTFVRFCIRFFRESYMPDDSLNSDRDPDFISIDDISKHNGRIPDGRIFDRTGHL
jgi:hypothetical protein